MQFTMRRCFLHVTLAVLMAAAIGCDQVDNPNSGISVMFEGRPNLYHEYVYYNGVKIGKIVANENKGSTVTRLIIAISPEYKDRISSNWAFYADGGRLNAARLQGGTRPLMAGDKLCGFSTKGRYHWFKLKTLLGDRVYKAGKRATHLFKRFELS